jgi:hypothetical protein
MSKEEKIRIFVLIILTGFIVSVVYHYVLGAYFLKGYPANSFLFTPLDKLNDFFNVYAVKGSIYFPFANFIINLFCLIKPAVLSLILFLSIWKDKRIVFARFAELVTFSVPSSFTLTA